MIHKKNIEQSQSAVERDYNHAQNWLGFPRFSREKPKYREKQALIGRFEIASIAWIPLVAEFGTDHIEKAVFVTSASIFSETVGGMELKFGEDQSLHRRILYY